jgi:YVTN family beta-propeller protein
VVDLGPVGIAVNPNTNMVYVSSGLSNTTYILEKSETYSLGKTIFYVIDGKTYSVVKTLLLSGLPGIVAVNPNTNMVYMPNYGSNTTYVIDGKTYSVVKTLNVGSIPFAVAVAGMNSLYKLIGQSNTDNLYVFSSACMCFWSDSPPV